MTCSADDLAEMVQALGPEEALGNLKVAQLREYCKAFGLEPARLKLDVIEQLGKYLQEVWSAREAAAATGASKRGCKATSEEKKGKKLKCSVDVESLKEMYAEEAQTGGTVVNQNQHASTTRVASPLRKRTRKTATVAAEQSSAARKNDTNTVDSGVAEIAAADQQDSVLSRRKRLRGKTASGVGDGACAGATGVNANVPADKNSAKSCGADASEPPSDSAKPWLAALLATRFMSEVHCPGGSLPVSAATVDAAGLAEQQGSDGQHRCEEEDKAYIEKEHVRTNVTVPIGEKHARGEMTYETVQDQKDDEQASSFTRFAPGASAAFERSRDDTDDASSEHGTPRKEDASEREQEDSEEGEQTGVREQVHDQTNGGKGALVEQEEMWREASERDDEEEDEETEKEDEHTNPQNVARQAAAEETTSIADDVVVPPAGVPLQLGEEHSRGELTYEAVQKQDAREKEEEDSDDGEVMRDREKVHDQTCDEKDELAEQEEEMPRREASERDDEEEDEETEKEDEHTNPQNVARQAAAEETTSIADDVVVPPAGVPLQLGEEHSRGELTYEAVQKQDAREKEEEDSDDGEVMRDREKVHDQTCDEKDELAEQEEEMPRREASERDCHEDDDSKQDEDSEGEATEKEDEEDTNVKDMTSQHPTQETIGIADGKEHAMGDLTDEAMQDQEDDEHASEWKAFALGASVAVERTRNDTDDSPSEHGTPRKQDASEEENSEEGEAMGDEEKEHDKTHDEKDELVEQEKEMPRREEASEGSDDGMQTEATRKEDEEHTIITDFASQSVAQEATSVTDDAAVPPRGVPLPLGDERKTGEMTHEAEQDQEGDEHALKLTAPALGASVAVERSRDNTYDAHSEHGMPRKQDASEVEDSDAGELLGDGGQVHDEKDELVDQEEEMPRREETSATRKDDEEHTNLTHVASQSAAQEATSVADDVDVPPGSVPLPLGEERTRGELTHEAMQCQAGEEHASKLRAPALGAGVAAPRKEDTSEEEDSEEGDVIGDEEKMRHQTCDEKDEEVVPEEKMSRREEASESDDDDAEGEAAGKENEEHTNIRDGASQAAAEETTSIADDVAVPPGGVIDAAVGGVQTKEIFATHAVETAASASSLDANVGFAASTLSTETTVMSPDASLVSCDFASGVFAEKISDDNGNQAPHEMRVGDVKDDDHELIRERRIDAGPCGDLELPGVALLATDPAISMVHNESSLVDESKKFESASADESMEEEEEEDLQRTEDPAEIDEDTGDEEVNACVAAMGEVYNACAAADGADDLGEAKDAEAHVYDVRTDSAAAVITETLDGNTGRSVVEAGAHCDGSDDSASEASI
eukprot:TRINITY_DN1619_c0_g1_i2.p1 TRINITY_DN1619_c0_g1~~TRINITY_DN1619_c0_g1_i2.p1  ORF type:complete len:1376 (-),score=361.22 TRINITY_DN1619_c0_g1_i2:566-4576(-)